MIVVDGGAHDDEIVDDGGRGGHVIPARIVVKRVAEADLASFAEIGAGGAGGGIYGDEAGVLRGFENAATARLIGGPRGVNPSGNAAIDEAVAVVAVEVDLGIVGPALRPGLWIEGHDAIEGGGQVESAVNKNWCGLEAATFSAAATLGNVAGVEGPGDLERGDVVAIR